MDVDLLAELIGESPAMAAIRQTLQRLLAAETRTRRPPPILLLGETGVGKSLLARALHRASPRAEGTFVDVNCAAIPTSLLEAELFGFERGAFTDARQAKPGLFEEADGGTLRFGTARLTTGPRLHFAEQGHSDGEAIRETDDWG